MVRIVKKPDERRSEILAAARGMFLQGDYEKATMQQLMNKLKIAKGTIYHYFSSKEDLLEAVVEDLVDQQLEQKRQLVETCTSEGRGAVETLRALSTEDHMAEDNENILEVLHRPGNVVMHSRQLGRYIKELAPIYAGVIESGCQEGVFKTAHPLECAEFLLAGIQFITDVGFYPWSQEDMGRRAEAIPSLVEEQLSAPKGSFDFLAG